MTSGQGAGKRPPTMSRRLFVGWTAVGAVALPSLLAACSAQPTPASPTAPTRPASAPPTTPAGAPPAATAASRPASALPTYLPTQGGPKPDYSAAGPLYEDGWEKYPANPVKSWTKDPPGTGSVVAVLGQIYNPPANPLDQNPAWQQVNRQLNATVQFNIFQPADYAAKVGTFMAGNDLPDIMGFNGGLNVGTPSGTPLGTANLPQFLQSKCADLAPYLAGDASKEYPNLAAIPTFAWQNSGSSFGGHLYLVPVPRYRPNQTFFKNVNFYDAEIGQDYVPKNADDLKRVLLQLNRPKEDRYATASYQGQAFFALFYSSMFGAPNNWRLESNGQLTKNFETPEFKEAVGYLRDLYAAGVFHPNTLNYPDQNTARLDQVAGKWVLYPEIPGQPWQDFWRRGLRRDPPFDFLPLPPIVAHDGGKPQHFLGAGFNVANALKQANPERVKELLRIMDYLASPFGTQEDLLLQYGVPGTDYALDSSGTLTLTDRSNPDANYVNWKYVAQHQQVMYVPDIPAFAKASYVTEQQLIPVGVGDPSWGSYSPTQGSKGVVLNRGMIDGITDIVAGRRPLADFDQLVKDWLSGGGEQIRLELQAAVAAAKA